MPIPELQARDLRQTCDPSTLGFATTAELEVEKVVLAQSRAVEAIGFGLGMRHHGYNVFVLGPSGTGRRTLIAELLRRAAAERPVPADCCYVNNFADPRRPVALCLPAGRGARLKADMDGWVDALKSAIPAAFKDEEFRSRCEGIEEALAERQRKALESLGDRAQRDGVALVRTPAGFTIAPVAGSEVMDPETFAKLAEDKQLELKQRVERYQAELEHVLHDIVQWRHESVERLQVLARETIERAVRKVTSELRERYVDLAEVVAFIDAAKEDVIRRGEELRKPAESTMEIGAGLVLRSQVDYDRYRVNVIVDNAASRGAPVVFEDNPTHSNLVGRVEHLSQLGTLLTDFNQIQPGALHRANGGYLVLDAAKVLAQPYSWEALKRALSTREMRIESLGQALSLMSTVSLEPQPFALDAKVVLFGPRQLYYLLDGLDPEFSALFRVAAEIEDDMDWTGDNARAIAQVVAALANRRGLRAFGADAVAAIVEHCARLADDAEKLSMHMQSLEEIVLESEDIARRAGRDIVRRADVEQATLDRTRRAARVQEQIQQAIRRGVIAIDTDGAVVGQVNGLGVFSLGRTRFAHPHRITATTRLGTGELIDIQKEASLSGAIHAKGVLTLTAFVAERFAHLRPLSLAASLSFEQTYEPVEGDSASGAELCALLSSLADVPVRQDLAITGSVNQLGAVQAVGAVNEKIEGFFDLCRSRGLTGTQGVIIPETNRKHLMLRADVVAAAASGRFHVYPVRHVDEAIELLTGVPAGGEGVAGDFPRESINGLVAARVAHLASLAQPREVAKKSLAAALKAHG